MNVCDCAKENFAERMPHRLALTGTVDNHYVDGHQHCRLRKADVFPHLQQIVHPVKSDEAENGKFEQVLSWRRFVNFQHVSGRFSAQPSRLETEILALRHQLNVLRRSVKRPRLSAVDRWLWVRLSRSWAGWRSAFKLSQTRHRHRLALQRFRAILDLEVSPSPPRPGRLSLGSAFSRLMWRMSWRTSGEQQRFMGKLLKLGFDISETNMSKCLVRGEGSPLAIVENVLGETCEELSVGRLPHGSLNLLPNLFMSSW
jgi:hypothetical protein